MILGSRFFPLLLSVILTCVAYSQPYWKWQNPYPQGSDINAVTFVDANIGFTVGQGGTINRTTDGGISWIQCTSSTTEDLYGVFFSDGAHGTAVGRVGTIVGTTDGGLTWSAQVSGSTGWLRDVAFAAPGVGTAVGVGGIVLHTTNDGQSWYPQTSGTSDHLFGIASPSPGHWVAVGNGGLILHSTDDGTSWTPQLSGTTVQLTDVTFITADRGVASGLSGTILRTTDKGANWVSLPSGTLSHLYSVTFSDTDNGIVAGYAGVIRGTTDGGATWSPRSSGTTEHLYDAGLGDADHVWSVGSYGEIITSTDRGMSWSSQSRGTRKNLHGVVFTDSVTGYVVGDDGRILVTIDGGHSWDESYSGTANHLADIQFIGDSLGIIVGNGGTILKTTDAGTWIPLTAPVAEAFQAVSFSDNDTGTIVGTNCPFLFTTNGGGAWSTTGYYGVRLNLHDVQQLDGATGFATGRAGAIFYTTEGWDSVLGPQPPQGILTRQNFNGLYFTDRLNGMVVGDSGLIFKTTDGCQTWEKQTSPTTNHFRKIVPTGENSFVIVGYNGTIIRSTDGGNIWTSDFSGTIDHLHNVFFINEHSGWAVGEHGTILHFEQPAGDSATSFMVRGGWNMLSVPYLVGDYTKNILFPTAVSNAFSFEDGYVASDTLANGIGYWLKFPDGQTIGMDGTWLVAETIDVAAGWNLVGSLSSRVDVADIGSIPGGITTSNFFAYDGSYNQSPVIDPGRGYWVKVSQPGKLVFSLFSNAPAGWRIMIKTGDENPPAPPENVDQAKTPTDLQYSLRQNSPNPFNPSTEISYTTPVRCHIRLDIYDLLGRQMANLVDRDEEPGSHTVRWNVTNIPNGVYFYRLTTDQFSRTMKLVVVK